MTAFAIVGSARRDPAHLKAALEGADTVMACNLACEDVKANMVVVVEEDAALQYSRQILRAVDDGAIIYATERARGAMVNTLWRHRTGRRIPIASIAVRDGSRLTYLKMTPVIGPSGAVAVQVALDMDATEIRMIGLTGYTDEDIQAGGPLAGAIPAASRMRNANRRQGQILDFCIREHPRVQFTMYGQPVYDLPTASNLQVETAVMVNQ